MERKMKRFIYYPDFEVRDETWLKFAPLYLEEINPIIPFSGEKHLSKEFANLIESSDLIKPIRPTDNQGRTSSLDATGKDMQMKNTNLLNYILSVWN
ncbi:hypothetical protein [Desulfitibacter alkalitolerans]|uniref:hypothetical protein n=1 Tax=Desulfitibacter alkalitolerans TaxID=264641 RepID=UPI0012EC508B|nr:hypothetical protein [Desulfitibacter alkalitolerans]